MNIETVKSLFLMFSGEESAEKFMPLITLALAETDAMLNDNAEITDIRLDFLSAAIANYRLQQINAAHDRSEVVYAGKMPSSAQSCGSTLRYAERLLADYINLCGSLIKPKTFMFMSVGKDTEGLIDA